jgi:hypothetical protein
MCAHCTDCCWYVNDTCQNIYMTFADNSQTLKELALKSAPSKAHTDLAASTRSKLDQLYARSELSAVVKTVLDKLNSPETKDKKDKQSQ